MPRIAFVFPGQGAQYVGMGQEMASHYSEAAEVFAQADQISDYKISDICFSGPADMLNKTEFAQPALLTVSLAVLAVVLKEGIKPDLLAGLSLGEYTALVAAGAVDFKEALPLVQKRARLMQEAVPQGQGAMAAVLGMDLAVLADTCREAGGVVDIANLNCPGQVVIAGEREAVLNAGKILKEKGGRFKLLEVSVPSHSRLMTEAAAKLREDLQKITWHNPEPAVISNVTGNEHNRENIADLLVKQMYSPVQWEASIRYMAEKVDYFIEIGPGTALSGLIKRTVKGRMLGNVEDIKSLDKVIREVKTLA
ncbi:MAG: ACP S-malonyltransferase [Syntrophomonadaceae bacterium]|jgi:[acyl-carrier-protein] S-malonyltransferase